MRAGAKALGEERKQDLRYPIKVCNRAGGWRLGGGRELCAGGGGVTPTLSFLLVAGGVLPPLELSALVRTLHSN